MNSWSGGGFAAAWNLGFEAGCILPGGLGEPGGKTSLAPPGDCDAPAPACWNETRAGRWWFQSLLLFASSPFLGELKAQLGSATSALLKASHDVDLASVGLVELDHRIARETSPH